MDTKRMQGVEACGFCFLNGDDAKLAEKERKQIDFIESKMDYTNHEKVLSIYSKLIEEQTFKTPNGTIYLKYLQNFLLNKTGIDRARVYAIPVYEPCDKTYKETESVIKKRAQEVKKKEEAKRADKYKISVIINILLGICILIMFWVATASDVPNILNYKRALEDKYATWEEELDEREAIVRQKEKELRLTEE